MIVYILSILLSAFLIFQVQPLVGKMILPWFGGTSSVWSAVLMFFQVLLTGGYAYAYWLLEHLPLRRQAKTHLTVLGVSLLLVAGLAFLWPSPVTPGASLAGAVVHDPILEIFKVLALSVGLPYFVLATNSTIIQAWFSRANPARPPYWLYAVSNGGSLLALLSYPLLIEPVFPLITQGRLWAAGFALFALLTISILLRGRPRINPFPAPAANHSPQTPTHISHHQLMWVALSATASVLLLATTSQLTQEIPPIPFLWVLPLAVYLLSFVVAFSGDDRYSRPVFTILLAAGSIGIVAINTFSDLDLYLQIAVYIFFLFSACMVAHGELYKLRPAAVSLSRFYLLVSVGGALGGIAVNLLAPLLFTGFWEFYIGWAALLVLLVVLLFIRKTEGLSTRWQIGHDTFVGLQAILVLAYGTMIIFDYSGESMFQERNFYGVSVVYHDRDNESYRLIHGSTVHGLQFIEPELRQVPTTYYWEQSGVGRIIRGHPDSGEGFDVGLLGLGTGTLAAYGQPGDRYRFYEINPDVIELATGQGGFFSFLEDSQAEISIVAGDARIQLEQELAQGEVQGFDVLVLDTFSSDAIPVHLLTREAFALYLQHLSPNGVIAVNISNRYLDLKPVVWLAAEEFGLHTAHIEAPVPDGNQAAFYSEWMLLTRDPAILDAPEIAEAADLMEGFTTNIRLWTDDYSNLFQILKR
jgi:hypothetical protein